jgi:hypothetical protein
MLSGSGADFLQKLRALTLTLLPKYLFPKVAYFSHLNLDNAGRSHCQFHFYCNILSVCEEKTIKS